MIMILKNLFLLACLVVLARCEGEPEIEKGVYVLTTKNFDDFIQRNPFVFVEFYAPWCGHCKALAPKWEAVANQLKDRKFDGKDVFMAKVDATVESELGTRFEVQGYPTLKWFAKGQSIEYEGPGRDEKDLLEFIEQHADPSWEPPKSVVVELTGENFDSFVNDQEIALVEFYAPWCGHCKRLAPEYDKAARKLNDRKTPIPLAKVDATADVNKDLATKYEIQGYPTLKIFRKGRAFEFKSKGQPDEKSIVAYMEKQALPPSRIIENKKDFKKTVEGVEEDMVVVGYFESESDPFFQQFNDAASELRDDDFKFSHVFGRDSWKEYDITKPTIAVYVPSRFQTKYEPKRHEFSNKDATRQEIAAFIVSNSVPLVGHYTHSTREKRYNNKRPLCLFFFTVDFSHEFREATQTWRKKIADIANDFRDITFAIANDDEFETVMRELGVDDTGEEMNVACYDARGTKYPMLPAMEEWSAKHVRSFLTKMKKGELKPFFKSQPIPKNGREKDGHVSIVVANSFSDIVLNSDKDVLLFLHAPWCGHCKNFAPEYKQLADQLIPQQGDNLIFAKMDATANDLPAGYEANGYPTIYFAAAGKKDTPFKYEGNRALPDIITFMKKHATKAFIAGKTTVTDNEKEEL